MQKNGARLIELDSSLIYHKEARNILENSIKKGQEGID